MSLQHKNIALKYSSLVNYWHQSGFLIRNAAGAGQKSVK